MSKKANFGKTFLEEKKTTLKLFLSQFGEASMGKTKKRCVLRIGA
jgi:hypothetical protein